MSYRVEITSRAAKKLEKLSDRDYEKVRQAIRNLAIDPRPAGCKKLVGRNAWRIRIGDYRVIYEINDGKMLILAVDVGHRRDIYQ